MWVLSSPFKWVPWALPSQLWSCTPCPLEGNLHLIRVQETTLPTLTIRKIWISSNGFPASGLDWLIISTEKRFLPTEHNFLPSHLRCWSWGIGNPQEQHGSKSEVCHRRKELTDVALPRNWQVSWDKALLLSLLLYSKSILMSFYSIFITMLLNPKWDSQRDLEKNKINKVV